MNFAVIGSAHGHIKEFIEVMLENEGNFVGVFDDGSDLSKELKNKYNVPLYESIEDIFARGIDIAGTSAINNEKIDIIEACSKHGVHIIADKPIVVNEKQFTKLNRIIEKDEIEIGLMLTLRFNPCINKIKTLLENKKIGELLSMEIFSPHTLRKETRADWHFNKQQKGGIVIDLMIHSLDLFNWFTESKINDFQGVKQKSILEDKENFYDNCQVYLQTPKGITGYLRVDWHMPEEHWSWGDIRFFCTGTEGSLEARVTGDPLTRESQIILFEKGEKTREIKIENKSQSSVIDDFIQRINGDEFLIGHQEILEATRQTIKIDNNIKKINLINNKKS